MSTAPPVTPAVTPTVPVKHVSWLKRLGSAIYVGLKDVVGLLSNPAVQKVEMQVANVATLLLPAEGPLIQTFQGIMGKIFQQAVVSEVALQNVASATSNPQKLAAVVGSIGPELDQWVANNFPGSATVSAEVKAGLVNAIVALQNAITVPPASTPAPPTAKAA